MRKLFPFIPAAVPDDLKYGIKSINEEIANMLSHGVGFVLFLIGAPLLLYKSIHSDTQGYLIGSMVFCFSLLMVYTSSTIYHSVYKVKLRRKLRVFDHISIYFLIAGSFTPFLLVTVQSETGKWVLITQWLMVLIGSVFKFFFTHKFKLISTLAYVGMGALSLFVIEPLRLALPLTSYQFLQVGLFSYLFGVPFYLWGKLPFNHLIWHLFVLAGSVSHFVAVWLMI